MSNKETLNTSDALRLDGTYAVGSFPLDIAQLHVGDHFREDAQIRGTQHTQEEFDRTVNELTDQTPTAE